MRAHVFLCMLAYYVEWHMRQALALLLFDDDDKAAREAGGPPVAPAQRSPRAQRKTRHPTDRRGNSPIHSFQTLLDDLANDPKSQPFWR